MSRITPLHHERQGLGAAATGYAQRGWSVIPLRPRDKRPAVKSWEKWQRERADAQGVARYWRQHPLANIGIVTGAVSGLVVLDVDGDAGRESLRGRHLPLTPVVETGRGYHYYFTHPGGEVRTCKPAPGLDLKAEGGYVVAPPSVHPSGRRYRWAEGLSPDDVPLAPLPEWLLQLSARPTGKRTPPEEWRRLVAQDVVEGSRNNTLARLAGHLLRRGVDPFATLELLRCWNVVKCRPPLPEAELVRTVDSIAGRELRRRFGGFVGSLSYRQGGGA